MEPIEKITLSSGLRIILVPQPESLATTVAVLVEAGSKYETKEINGLSHFLEHMCFKGTTNRPKSIDIVGELDGLGAEYNAFTGHEYTSYFAKARNELFDRILEIVSDLYLNPNFPPEEIEKEKGVIIEELNMYEDLPQRKAPELFMELLYGDTPAGWSVGGRKEVIRRLGRDDFLAYRDKHYQSQATVLVIAGGFDPKNAVRKVESHFRGFKSGQKDGKMKVEEFQEKPASLVKFKETDQTHLVLGFRAFSIFDERRFALQVLADILGGGMSSRLFQRVREELGAAYYVNASTDFYSDHGILAMAAGVNNEKVHDVIKASLEEFRRLTEEKIKEAELRLAKNHLVGRFFLSLETSDELGFFYGGQEVMGIELQTPKEVANRIQAVTASEIQAVARDIIRNGGLNLALIGPFKHENFLDILKL